MRVRARDTRDRSVARLVTGGPMGRFPVAWAGVRSALVRTTTALACASVMLVGVAFALPIAGGQAPDPSAPVQTATGAAADTVSGTARTLTTAGTAVTTTTTTTTRAVTTTTAVTTPKVTT